MQPSLQRVTATKLRGPVEVAGNANNGSRAAQTSLRRGASHGIQRVTATKLRGPVEVAGNANNGARAAQTRLRREASHGIQRVTIAKQFMNTNHNSQTINKSSLDTLPILQYTIL